MNNDQGIKVVAITTPEEALTRLVCEMFCQIGLSCQAEDGTYSLAPLEGKLLSREPFLGMKVADTLLEYIPKLKCHLKSSALTSLHSNSKSKQRNPALNLFRQTLRCLGLHLKPVVVSNGYCKQTGKKQYKRYYKLSHLSKHEVVE